MPMDALAVVRVASRIVLAYKAGKVLLALVSGRLGRDVSNAELARIGRSGDDGERKALADAQDDLRKAQDAVKYWSKFGGSEDPDFAELIWSGIEDGGGPIRVGDGGALEIDAKGCEELHDRWIDWIELGRRDQVSAEVRELRRRFRSKSVTVGRFLDEVDAIKRKFQSLTKNNRLSSGEDDAWEELERGRRWSVGGYDIYRIDDFRTMSAVAGIDPETGESKTEWCVAKESSYFRSYGPPYYLFAKGRSPEYLLNLNSSQFKDRDDVAARSEDALRAAGEFIMDVLKAYVDDCDEDFRRIPGLDKYAGNIWWIGTVDFGDPLRGKEALAMAGRLDSPAIRQAMAGNRTTPEEKLEELAGDPEEEVRLAVASNEGWLSDKAIERLSGDASAKVRAAVASRHDLGKDTMARLADDRELSVRLALCGNSGATGKILDHLADEDDERVRFALARNRAASEELLDRIAEGTRHPGVMQQLAKNPNTGVGTLTKLGERSRNRFLSAMIRKAINSRRGTRAAR